MWIEAAGIVEGPLFRPVSRSGRVRGDARLSDKSVAKIVKAYAQSVGLNVDDFAAHSLRAGFITTAADRDVSEARLWTRAGLSMPRGEPLQGARRRELPLGVG